MTVTNSQFSDNYVVFPVDFDIIPHTLSFCCTLPLLFPFPLNSLLSDFHQIWQYLREHVFSPDGLFFPVCLLSEYVSTHMNFTFSPSQANLESVNSTSYTVLEILGLFGFNLWQQHWVTADDYTFYHFLCPLSVLEDVQKARQRTLSNCCFLTDPSLLNHHCFQLMDDLTCLLKTGRSKEFHKKTLNVLRRSDSKHYGSS